MFLYLYTIYIWYGLQQIFLNMSVDVFSFMRMSLNYRCVDAMGGAAEVWQAVRNDGILALAYITVYRSPTNHPHNPHNKPPLLPYTITIRFSNYLYSMFESNMYCKFCSCTSRTLSLSTIYFYRLFSIFSVGLCAA